MQSIKKRMLVVLSPVIALAVLRALATKPKNLGANNGRSLSSGACIY